MTTDLCRHRASLKYHMHAISTAAQISATEFSEEDFSQSDNVGPCCRGTRNLRAPSKPRIESGSGRLKDEDGLWAAFLQFLPAHNIAIAPVDRVVLLIPWFANPPKLRLIRNLDEAIHFQSAEELLYIVFSKVPANAKFSNNRIDDFWLG